MLGAKEPVNGRVEQTDLKSRKSVIELGLLICGILQLCRQLGNLICCTRCPALGRFESCSRLSTGLLHLQCTQRVPSTSISNSSSVTLTSISAG